MIGIEGHPRTGWVEIITGSMFSGKTEELIRRLKRALIAKQKVTIFKPKIDNRYDETKIVSHSQSEIQSIVIDHPREILEHAIFAQVIGIDEAQFFSDEIIEIVDKLANSGKRVVIAGLDKDYRAVPFGPIPALLAKSEYVSKMLAICVRCGAPATYTQRIIPSKEQIVVGAQDSYEARCRHCFEMPTENEEDK
ncbi:MAG: thymidine kinase [Candidatus Marinimicrobia bacterium]|nr:thymidine kinase [Candidatus Neomarinimicrobiota bacterium]